MNKLKDDNALLDLMIKDMREQNEYYTPGSYWYKKTRRSIKQIKKLGISDFRGTSSVIGESYTDNLLFDVRKRYHLKIIGRIINLILSRIYPFKQMFNSQVKLTENYLNKMLKYKHQNIEENHRIQDLLSNYKIPYSMLGGCIDYINVNNDKIAIQYLNLLDQLDVVSRNINISETKSIFEIGGGYGINIHLILENFRNIKKIIYLDIPPNLYVGTQYLKAFYGDAVIDYRQTRNKVKIKFSENEDLEILAIAPWQIETIECGVDIFWNAHSFVEMPQEVVKNYVNILETFKDINKMAIALISYDGFNPNTTIQPDKLTDFFDSEKFNTFNSPSILEKDRVNYYYIAK